MKERRKNKFESKNGMIIVDATGKTQKTTYPPIGIGYNRKLMARRQPSPVALSSYKNMKKMVAVIEKELGIKVPMSLVRKGPDGAYPPIGIKIDDKIVKVIKPNGKK